MQIYHYNPVTREYLRTTNARLDPLASKKAGHDVFLIPAHATDTKPPVVQAGEVPIYSQGSGWSSVPDHRGETWYDQNTREPVVIDSIEIPASLVMTQPEIPLAEAKANKKAEIKSAMATQLSNGFTTQGGITMDATAADIRLLDDGMRLAQRLSQTAMDIRDYGNTVHIGQTIADVETMVNELAINYQQALAKKWAIEAQIDAAATVAAVQAIIW